MYLLSIIPIARGIPADFLSYWSPEKAELGAIVKIPLRKKEIFGIVLTCQSAEKARAEIRGAGFAYKKIESQKARKILPSPLMEILPTLADYFATSPGSMLSALVPKAILESHSELDEAPVFSANKLPREILALQKNEEDRMSHYKSIIRERLARSSSTLFILPSAEEIEHIKMFLTKGIEDRTVVIHNKKTKKEIIVLWNTIARSTQPLLIIATAGFVSLPRNDISLIIVDEESSRSYKTIARPFADMRTLIEIYAKKIGADVLFGDMCMRPETFLRIQNHEIREYVPSSMRSLSTAKETVVDMKKIQKEKPQFSVLSDELVALIRRNKENNEHLFIYATRKGLAGNTVCQDCGTALTCDRCSAALTLYKKGDERIFICNKCSKRFPTDTVCLACGSWRLMPLGIGTERVEEEIKQKMPGVKIFRLDKTSATTPLRAKKILTQWMENPGSVLVGTEFALSYIHNSIEAAAVASLDSLFALPDFRINERVFSLILKLRVLAEKNLLIQSRFPEQKAIQYGMKGNIGDFLRDELELREKISFPPFSTFIKVSFEGNRLDAEKAIGHIRTIAGSRRVEIF
ncbi:MAG TPA: hypothetical protein VMR73_00130, partial [Candidatus Paceibacterota bacterium]|nr:hypothetical protein [Candidatus Paceibacterota bacterium]